MLHSRDALFPETNRDPVHGLNFLTLPLNVRLDDGRQTRWQGRLKDSTTLFLSTPQPRVIVRGRPPSTMDRRLIQQRSRRAARKVLNVLQNSDVIEITMPLEQAPDLVFRFSLEGAPEAIAQACARR